MVVESLEDEALVISGISGKFPNTNSVDELMENFFNSVDCISENHTRWPKEQKQVPHCIGTILEITRFDNTSLGISTIHAKSMIPVSRMLTTSVVEAIFDARLKSIANYAIRTSEFLEHRHTKNQIKAYFMKSTRRSNMVSDC
ncbi:hypothetical protein M0802_014570 [Mischocyttarus mexicanus]|nr:hypothetical protein M0802_014570 [Mischocyttarus mexicanus]